MAIIFKCGVELVTPPAGITDPFVFLIREAQFSSGSAGNPLDTIGTNANALTNGGGDLQVFSDALCTARLPIEIITFVTSDTVPSVYLWVRALGFESGDVIYFGKDDTQTVQPAVGAAFGRNATWLEREYQYNLFDTSTLTDSKGITTPTTSGIFTDSIDTIAAAPVGGGVRFSVSAQVDLNQNIGDTTGDITFRAWVNRYQSNTFGTIISIYDGVWAYSFRLESDNPGLLIGGSSPESTGPILTLNQWHQLHVTVSGTSITYYVDGAVDSVKTVTGTRTLRPTINTTIGMTAGGIHDPRMHIAGASVELAAISSDKVTSENANQSSATYLNGTLVGYEAVAGGGISVTALLNSNYMVEYSMKKNVASQSIGAQMVTIADGTDFTGTVTAEVTIDGGTKTAGGGTVTHEGEGYHSYAPTQAETNGDHIAVSFAGTGALTQTIQVYTTFPQTVDNDVAISALNDFNPVNDAVANVTLCATTTTNTDMRGTDSANTVVPPSVAQFNARTRLDADYFSWATDAVANVTLVATTTTNTDMRGTDSALLSSGYTAPDNAGITQTQADIAALNDLSSAQVNAEMLDVLVTDTFAEVSVPGSTASIKDMIHYTFSRTTAKTTQTATTLTVRNTGDTGDLATATVTDDGTTFTKGKEI